MRTWSTPRAHRRRRRHGVAVGARRGPVRWSCSAPSTTPSSTCARAARLDDRACDGVRRALGRDHGASRSSSDGARTRSTSCRSMTSPASWSGRLSTRAFAGAGPRGRRAAEHDVQRGRRAPAQLGDVRRRSVTCRGACSVRYAPRQPPASAAIAMDTIDMTFDAAAALRVGSPICRSPTSGPHCTQ